MHDHHSRKQQQQAAGGMNRDPPQMLVAIPALEQASNLPTLVKTLREMSATVERTLSELPPVNPSDTSQARKKTWSMRSRMGCLTCRSRHVKCDELQPRCKRCTLSERECVYGKAARDAVAPAPGLCSVDWHIKEAINYYVHVIDPMHAWHAEGDSAYQFNHEAVKIMNRRYFDGDVFAMYVLAHRLQCLYSLQCIAPRYGNISSLKPLWLRLFKQMAVVIDRLNNCLTTPDSFLAFRCIRMLMYVELSFAIPTWRAHAEGFGALIKSNPRELADLFSSDLFVVQYPLVVASMCNTTSPANNQIQNLSNWSDKDIATAYSHTGCHAFPCPTAVFQAMIRITHLRTLVAANVEAPEWPEWEELARAAFEKIWSVDPHNWGELYAADASDMSVLDAQIYQAAVSLYAILTLPPQLAALFPFVPRREERTASGNSEGTGEVNWETADEQVPSSTLPNSVHHTIVALGGTEAAELKPEADQLEQIHAALEQDNSRTARVRYRSRLFRLFQRSAAANLWTGSLLWPVAVLGVAFPHHKAEQVALLDHIGYQRGWPSSENGAACLYEKLVLFWDSGRRGWEQCFYEPTNVLT